MIEAIGPKTFGAVGFALTACYGGLPHRRIRFSEEPYKKGDLMEKRKYLYIASCTVLALAFTAYVVTWSTHFGKLSVPPDYDDSHSIVEGAVRLLNFQANGFQAAWDEYRLRNTHSYLHYYWPALLYSMFGIHQSVVYWANGLFLLGVILAFGTMLKSINWAWKLIWIIGFLGIPVCFHLIHDFRSEVTMAALIFMGCAASLLWIWEEQRTLLHFSITALCFALALGMKPVMFPYTLGMLGLCCLVFLTRNLFIKRDEMENSQDREKISHRFGSVRVSFFWVAALWAIVILPNALHFYLYRELILDYIHRVAFGSDFYKLKETYGTIWAFHWLGYSGVWHLSTLRIFFVVIAGVGIVCSLIPRLRAFAPDEKWLSLACITFGAFLGIAINSVEQPFFGMTFQLLLTATALSFLAHVFARAQQQWIPVFFVIVFGFLYINPCLNRPILWPGVLVVIALTMIACFLDLKKPLWVPFICSGLTALLCWLTTEIAPYNNYVQRTISEAGPEGLAWRRTGPESVFQLIDKDCGDDQGKSSPIIWCSGYGWVDGRTIAWEAVMRRKKWMAFNELELKKPQNSSYPPYADYLVISDPGVIGSIRTPYTKAVFSDLGKFLDDNRNLKVIGEVKDPKGNKITVIKNLDAEHCQKSGVNCPDWLVAQNNRFNHAK